MGLLFDKVCEYENLKEAFQRARKGKTLKLYVLDFERDLEVNLRILHNELLLHCYRPKPLETFILHDPKTRKISKSDFRDRIVHHAICNIIEPIFEKQFIYDSYANRIGKGTLKAIGRLHHFKRIVSRNNSRTCYVLKADISRYFETVDHKILLSLLAKKIYDKEILWLIGVILENHQSTEKGKGMPLGNLTSQFFANVYLHELDHFVKNYLKAKYYIRYVDDFVILHENKQVVLPIQQITKKTKNFQKKIRASQEQFSYQKTVQLLKKGNTIQRVADLRGIKKGTVWEHSVKGIASNNLSIYQVLTKERVLDILFHIHSPVDTLKMIKERIPSPEITYNEIACVLAYYRVRNRKCKKMPLQYILNDRQNTHQPCQKSSLLEGAFLWKA